MIYKMLHGLASCATPIARHGYYTWVRPASNQEIKGGMGLDDFDYSI